MYCPAALPQLQGGARNVNIPLLSVVFVSLCGAQKEFVGLGGPEVDFHPFPRAVAVYREVQLDFTP